MLELTIFKFMELQNRLLAFIDYLNTDKANFEKEVGLSNGFVDKASNNTRQSSLNRISNRYPILNVDWLKSGKGEMLKSGNVATASNRSVSVGGGVSSSTINNNIIAEKDTEILLLKKDIERLNSLLEEKERMIQFMLKNLNDK